jgi:hypothetical protein
LGIAEGFFEIETSPASKELHLKGVRPKCGNLVAGSEFFEMSLVSDACFVRLQPNAHGSWSLPPGVYRTCAFGLSQSSGSSSVLLEGRKASEEMLHIEIAANETKNLSLGTPLKLSHGVAAGNSKHTVKISFGVLTGSGGEEYAAKVTRIDGSTNRSTVSYAPPRFKLFDGSGTQVGEGEFNYG